MGQFIALVEIEIGKETDTIDVISECCIIRSKLYFVFKVILDLIKHGFFLPCTVPNQIPHHSKYYNEEVLGCPQIGSRLLRISEHAFEHVSCQTVNNAYSYVDDVIEVFWKDLFGKEVDHMEDKDSVQEQRLDEVDNLGVGEFMFRVIPVDESE